MLRWNMHRYDGMRPFGVHALNVKSGPPQAAVLLSETLAYRYDARLLESRTIRLQGRRTIPDRISPESKARRLSPA